MTLKRLKTLGILVAIFVLAGGWAIQTRVLAAAFNPDYVVSDSAFDFSSSSWDATQIDNWLNANYPTGCISGSFRAADPQRNNGNYTFGGQVTGGKAIYDAAKAYSLDPKIIITMLQKEQSIISGGAGCYANTPNPSTATNMTNKCGNGTRSCTIACPHAGGCMTIAMSYGCPNYCDVNDEGFSKQLILGAWVLKFAEQRAYGNTTGYPGYDTGDENFSYSGALVPPAGDGSYVTVDGDSLTIANGATASLYTYNPFVSPNQNFFNIYVGWFGNPTTPCFGTTNVSGKPSGRQILSVQYSKKGTANLAFTRLNNTGSACAEVHVWNSNYTGWQAGVPTALKSIDPTNSMFVFGNFSGDSRDELTYVKYASGGGTSEMHTLDSSYKSWQSQVATNLPNTSTTAGTFVAGDFNDSGKDQLAYIKYANGSGQVELHKFSSDLKRATGIYDVATNLTGVTATSGMFVAGDFLGRGYDQLIYVRYSGGRAEIHMFDKSLKHVTGTYDVSTNLMGVTAISGTFVAGDFLGRGYDQLIYAQYNGSSGRVETHMFTRDLKKATGFQDIVTSLAGFDPST